MNLTPAEKKIEVVKQCADLFNTDLLARLWQLDSDYFHHFTIFEMRSHFQKLSDRQSKDEIDFGWTQLDEKGYALTLIGEDISGFFTVLTGLLVSYDFSIRLGKAFTLLPPPNETQKPSYLIDYLILEHEQNNFLTENLQKEIEFEFNRLINLIRGHQLLEMRKVLYFKIGNYFSRNFSTQAAEWLPIEIQFETDQIRTCLIIRGSERKGILFSVCNSLMLQGIVIQKLVTESEGLIFEDRIYITDLKGQCITDFETLNRLKIAIILLERFTGTLSQAMDYSVALENFNQFVKNLFAEKSATPDLPGLTDYLLLATLAKVLGAGSFLWEELLKIPTQELIHLLQGIHTGSQKNNTEVLEKELANQLSNCQTYVEKVSALNQFKDLQLFRFDVAYLAGPYKTLQEFSNDISDLADLVLDTSLWLAFNHLKEIHGSPKERKNHRISSAHFGLFAQGKLGGRELGYASDLEIQLIYRSNETSQVIVEHNTEISNAEFFSLLVGEIRKNIISRKDGIFELDLRLRPHGESGPLATKLENWVEYYSEGGQALDFERQALLKLRTITSTPGFDNQVLAARDAVIFGEFRVGFGSAIQIHKQQLELKTKSQIRSVQKINAKYSLGGLVEIEYGVQFLQLQHGRKITALREPNTEKALEILLAENILSADEFEILYRGYIFHRRLINALRMLRGNARDLFIPDKSTTDFLYLARRMGYVPTNRFGESEQLDWDINKTFKKINFWFNQHYENPNLIEAVSDPNSLSTLFLNPQTSDIEIETGLVRLGCENVEDPRKLITYLFGSVKTKGLLVAVLVIAEPKLRISPDPEKVLKQIGHFLSLLAQPEYFLKQILNEPHLLEILIKIFGHSEFLTHLLFQNPESIFEIGHPSVLEKSKIFSEFKNEIENKVKGTLSFNQKIEKIQKYRDLEYLRIGLRDIYLSMHLQKITTEISQLSNAIIEKVFELTMLASNLNVYANNLSVIALGKLGGNELNYSSDIDIVFVYDFGLNLDLNPDFETWAKLFVTSLNQSGTGSGNKLFRVDLQLRPYGSHSSLVLSSTQFEKYYHSAASGWELQAWLKARPLAGSFDLGQRVIKSIQSFAVKIENREKIEASMRAVRQMGLEKLREENRLTTEVKLGPGGIRTVEFYVQYLQIKHGEKIPELISGNTLLVLGMLFKYHLISANYFDLLTKSYVFLRRIEHVLQLQGLQQRHELPSSEIEISKLAKKMGFESHLGISAASQFRTRYKQHILTLLDLSSSLFGYSTNLPGTV